jgi:hypothetical protein
LKKTLYQTEKYQRGKEVVAATYAYTGSVIFVNQFSVGLWQGVCTVYVILLLGSTAQLG